MDRTDMGRIVAFTDGVMAVAITLLVLGIEVPELPPGREDELTDKLLDLAPDLAAYALSFAVVGRYWIVHHDLFSRLQRFDGTLMGLNLLFLAMIVLVPFCSDLVDHYPDQAPSNVVFGMVLGMAALSHWAMTAHVQRAGLAGDAPDHGSRVAGNPTALTIALLFLFSVPLSALSTELTKVMWIATTLAHPRRRKS